MINQPSLLCLVEEQSAEVMLKAVLPKIIPYIDFKILTFDGKADLKKKLMKRLEGWRLPCTRFLILVDQDWADCKKLKNEFMAEVNKSKKNNFVIRIACRELENFFLGDLKAVEKGLSISGIGNKQNKKPYRDPDTCMGKVQMKNLINQNYGTIAGSRAISPYLNIEENSSRSFNVLIKGIKGLFDTSETH